MHRWGDPNVDWAGISDAARWIAKYLRGWGRVQVWDHKEKWGTVRVSCSLGWSQFYSITHPGYAYSRYPRWLWVLDCRVGRHLVVPLAPLILPWHKWLYRRAYRLALRRWPHLRVEILSGADFFELLNDL